MNIFETLKELSDNQRKKESKDDQTTKRKDPSYIYLDENNQIYEIPLSNGRKCFDETIQKSC
jgi:hypothetical protein